MNLGAWQQITYAIAVTTPACLKKNLVSVCVGYWWQSSLSLVQTIEVQ